MTPTPTTTPPADPAAPPVRPAAALEPPVDPVPWLDPDAMARRREYPYEKLLPWAGKHIAWNWEGTAILAGADTFDELADQLNRAGVNTSRVVFDYVDEPGATYL